MFVVSDKVAENEIMEEDVSVLVENLVADDTGKLVELWSWLVSNGGVNEVNVNRG